MCSTQTLGHVSTLNHCRKSIYKSCLAHTRLTHMQGIVLVLAAQHLYGALQFSLASYQWVVLLIGVVEASDELSPWHF